MTNNPKKPSTLVASLTSLGDDEDDEHLPTVAESPHALARLKNQKHEKERDDEEALAHEAAEPSDEDVTPDPASSTQHS